MTETLVMRGGGLWHFRLAGGYVYARRDGDDHWRQIARGGQYTGTMLTAVHATLRSDAQRWLRQRRAGIKRLGLDMGAM